MKRSKCWGVPVLTILPRIAQVHLVTDVRLVGGLPPPPPAPPAPVPPQYDKLKNLHLDIALVKDGKPNAAIVAPASGVYKTAAETVQRAIEDRTAVKVPILSDVGEYGQVKGELVVLAADHLYGHGLSRAGIQSALVSSDVPVEIDWEFAGGVASVVTTRQTTLRLSLTTPDELRIDGEPARARHAAGIYRVQLPAGRHVLAGAFPATDVHTAVMAALEDLLADGEKMRAQATVTAGPPVQPTVAELPAAFSCRVPGKVADVITIPSDEGTQLAVASDSTIHLLTHEGTQVGKLQTDGKIRTIRWWDEHNLLLVGCVDEKVIAFDRSGQRKWVSISEMDPAVYEAAKTYWFKSAPGHEGIHGLHTGPFDGGKSRCFVGSACTVEILDENGKLVSRTPVFWGPGRMFLLVAGRDSSNNLLVSRWPNGYDRLAILSSNTMAVAGQGYDGVPAGHSYVGGWTAQNRTGLFYEDLDGDDKKEVVTAINGTWNRVTVYSDQGHPLYNAQFGPGASSAPRARMRDMDVADLDGDGNKEILVGISEGLVVALSSQCQKLWSSRLPSPPVSLRCVAPHSAKLPWIVVGCDDGTVAALDKTGTLIRLGHVTGRPMHVVALQTPAGPVAVLATDKGEVTGFRIGDKRR